MKGFGVVEREKADLGVLITMQEPTQPMRAEAASAGFYSSPGWNKSYPRIQLFTVKELLAGKGIDHPRANVTFEQAPKATAQKAVSLRLPWDATNASQAARRPSKGQGENRGTPRKGPS
jgi:site-specific DNA-methyltransferase (adenine-specific)